jgi:HEAT repeat protein
MKIRNILAFVVCAVALAVAGYALAQESADAQREAAREALNKAHYEEAAQLLAEVFEMEKEHQEAGNDLYWQAFARYKLRRTEELKIAAELLVRQQEYYQEAETIGEGEALLARLYAELAERGEVHAAREIHEMSEDEMRREESRVAALESLMRMNPDKAMPILEDIVTGKKEASPEFRRHAIFILCQTEDPRTEDMLIQILQTSEDPELLSDVVMCLAMKDSDQALDAIVELFERSDDPQVDEAAMFAIGRHGGDRAFTMLADIARDPEADPEMRSQAMFALSQTGRDDEVADIAVNILKTETDRQMLEMALMTLGQLEGDLPDQVFLELIANPEADDELRAQALFMAAQRDDLSIDFLMKVYEEAEGRELKMQVCHVITQMGDEEEGLDALIQIARDETDPEIKQNAVFWIGQFDSPKAEDYLLEISNQ